MADWTHEPIKADEAAAGIRAISFIGLHDLSPKELSSLTALIGKLERRCHAGHTPKEKAVDAFLRDIEEVCKRHNISIGHEDGHGCFLILDYDDPRGTFGEGAYYDKRKRAR